MDMQCRESDNYAETLKQAIDMLDDVSAAYKASNWERAHGIEKQIAALYAPTDKITEVMISTLLEFTFRRAWFDGMHDQADRLYK
jgi:uncharacterized protein Yka (UPF0111/DUF47 family)